ncbi:MAG: HrpE/YscL family type III secretion apparatus protein [Nitrospirae bacterium]|nr:HrpE/YscL family type III secretion apparatus protein [Nitrospirota bacterium]
MGRIAFIIKDQFHSTGAKIIKASEYAEILKANEAIAAANTRAAEIIRESQTAYEAAKAKGYEDGMEEAKQEKSVQLIDTATDVVNYMATVEAKVVDVVMKAVEKLIGQISDTGPVVETVHRSLGALMSQKQVVLRVNPADAPELQARVSGILKDFPKIQFVDVQTDPNITRGGCILESDAGTVDARMETQLKALGQSLGKKFTEGAEGS